MVRLVVALLTAVTLLVGCGVQAPVVIPPRQRCVAQVGGTTAELDLEQARNAAIIAGVAIQRGLAPRAASIALATAFQESDIRNLDYGDRDSIGLFQQRPSQGWGGDAGMARAVNGWGERGKVSAANRGPHS